MVAGIEEGTIVELIAGPFKGEKAVVKRVDSAKEEITVELYESIVPIPITVRATMSVWSRNSRTGNKTTFFCPCRK